MWPDGSNFPAVEITVELVAFKTLRDKTLVWRGAGNSKNSNLPFETKKALLFSKSLLKLNQELASQSEWTENSIEARASTLFDVAIRVWPSVHSHDGAPG